MPSTPDFTFHLPDGYRIELRLLQGQRLELTMAVYKRIDKILSVKEFDIPEIKPVLEILLATKH